LYNPNAYPLEQHEKNLQCGGTPYKIVREQIDKEKMWINPNPIPPSREAQRRHMLEMLEKEKNGIAEN